jgi:hypothetical protein
MLKSVCSLPGYDFCTVSRALFFCSIDHPNFMWPRKTFLKHVGVWNHVTSRLWKFNTQIWGGGRRRMFDYNSGLIILEMNSICCSEMHGNMSKIKLELLNNIYTPTNTNFYYHKKICQIISSNIFRLKANLVKI